MRKPPRAAIRAATPLTAEAYPGTAAGFVCGVCGEPAETLTAWREHDEGDRPIAGVDAVLFVGTTMAHAPCRGRVEKHPRLYVEETGKPGHFPRLCGPCVHRSGRRCGHPAAGSNGGAGLSLRLVGRMSVVERWGSDVKVRDAVACEGRETTRVKEAAK